MERGTSIWTKILVYLSMIIGALVAIVPIIVVFFASFKTGEEYKTTGPLTMPSNWGNFANYQQAFFEGDMMLGFMNTVIILVTSLTGAIFIGTMAAYVINRFKFKANKVVMTLFLIATLIPGVTTQVTTYQIISGLGLVNTRFAAIVLFMGTDIISVYIFLQFLSNIPYELDESAMLDGASLFKVYRKIILPLLSPAITTVIIIKGVGIYNDFYTAFLYMPSDDLSVISTALYKFKGPYGSQWEVICAAVMLAIIPTIIVFLCLQKQIYNGVTQGAVK